MKKPFQVICYGNAVLSTHTTLVNAKRAISVRWANLKRKWAHAPGYTASFDIIYRGKRVYGRGGYV